MSPPWVTFRKGCWGDEMSFAASSLCTPHSPSLRSHLRCPFLGCWSQTVLGSATQRSDHRWGTPHLRTSLFTQHHLPEASIRTWEDAHRIEWLAAAGGAEQSFCVRGLTSITESLCLTWPVDSPLRANCDWVLALVIQFLWVWGSTPRLPWPLSPQALSLTRSGTPLPDQWQPPQAPNLPSTIISLLCSPVPSLLCTGSPDTSSPPYMHGDLVTLISTMLLMCSAHLSCGCTQQSVFYMYVLLC